MILAFALFFLIAAIDWLAVARGWKKVEYIAKPAAMLILLGILTFFGGFGSLPLICFGLGIFFSLVGDIFLMLPSDAPSDRWFLPGLSAFLLAHMGYIIGLNTPLPNVSTIWSLGLAVILALAAARLLRRIIASLHQKGLHKLVIPVGVYGTVITLMVLSAFLTTYNASWITSSAALVAGGALFFFLSDLLLAWNKFVNPIKNARLANMILYHLGQFALVAGIILQFGRG